MAIEINWGLLQPVDVGGQFTQGFERGKQQARERAVEGALSDLMPAMVSGAAVDPQRKAHALGALAMYAPDRFAAYSKFEAARREQAIAQAAEERRKATLGLYGTDPAAARSAALGAADTETLKVIDQLDDTKREQIAAGARLLEQTNPTDQPSYENALQLAKQAGIDVSTAPPQFDPTWVEGIKHLGRALNTTKPTTAPANIQEYEYAVNQGYQGTYEKWRSENGSPFVVDLGNGQKKIYPSAQEFFNEQGGGAPASVAPAASTGAVASTLASSLPAPVVAGFMGNFHAEGGYGGAKGDGGSAAGIAQWRGERQANFQRIIGKPPEQATPDEQAKFVLWEMNNPEQAGMTVAQRDAIMAAKTPGEAAALIDQYYERSSGEHRQKRVAAAELHGGTVKVASKDQFDKLPSGTRFVAPDGSIRVKP